MCQSDLSATSSSSSSSRGLVVVVVVVSCWLSAYIEGEGRKRNK
jgi:hypothetical protein